MFFVGSPMKPYKDLHKDEIKHKLHPSICIPEPVVKEEKQKTVYKALGAFSLMV